MENAEICILAGMCSTGRLLQDPWRHKGFAMMAQAFIRGHPVLMGREAWFDFPFKNDESITPWVLTENLGFQVRTRAQYSHVRFAEDLEVIQSLVPLKGIWWVLGGFSVYKEVFPFAHSVEAVVVTDSTGTVDWQRTQHFDVVHSCPNPFDRNLKCARYERPQISAFHLQQMQGSGVRRNLPQ